MIECLQASEHLQIKEDLEVIRYVNDLLKKDEHFLRLRLIPYASHQRQISTRLRIIELQTAKRTLGELIWAYNLLLLA